MILNEKLLDKAKTHPRVIQRESHRSNVDFEAVSLAEIETFRINPDWIDDLEVAQLRYEIAIDVISADQFHSLGVDLAADRELVRKIQGNDVDATFDNYSAAEFMYQVSGLPYDQCWAWILRVDALTWRLGISSVEGAEMSDDYHQRCNAYTKACEVYSATNACSVSSVR